VDKLIAGAKKLGLVLTQHQIEQFRLFYQELIDWNRRFNLTAITDYEEVQIKHFLDSLTVILALEPPEIGQAQNIIDVGTGAGLPGVPLKIICPETKLVLLEATAKKTAFLHHLTRRLGLEDIDVIAGRAEEIAHDIKCREKFDLVLSRGVAGLPTLIELTLPFCAVGGLFIAQRKGDIESELSPAGKAISTLGGSLKELKRITMEEFSDNRCLVVIEKTSPTPDKYPRRPGMPSKKPLL